MILHNYVRLLAAINDEFVSECRKIGGLAEMVVDHDDDCPFLVADGRCRCNPVIRIVDHRRTIKRWEYRKIIGGDN